MTIRTAFPTVAALLFLTFIGISLVVSEDYTPAIQNVESELVSAFLQQDGTTIANLALRQAASARDCESFLNALCAFQTACPLLDRQMLASALQRLTTIDIRAFADDFTLTALKEILLAQYSRLEDDTRCDSISRELGIVPELYIYPPLFSDARAKGTEIPEKLSMFPSALGELPVKVQQSSGTFSPYASSARKMLARDAYVCAGFAFDIEKDMPELYLSVRCETQGQLFWNSSPLVRAGVEYRRNNGISLAGTNGLVPITATDTFRISDVVAGRNTVFVLIPVTERSLLTFYLFDGDNNAISATFSPLLASELALDAEVPRQSLLTRDKRRLNRHPSLGIFFPYGGVQPADFIKKVLSAGAVNLHELLCISRLISMGTAFEFVRGRIEAIASTGFFPLVSDWLYATRSTQKAGYDEKCRELYPAYDASWLRLVLSGIENPVERGKAIIEFSQLAGFTTRLINELTGCVSNKTDYEFVAKELVKWPLNTVALRRLAFNESLPAETRIEINELLTQRTLTPLPHREEIVRLLVSEGDVARAIGIASDLCRRYPWVAKFWAISGELYYKTGQKELCVRSWQTALSLDPKYPHISDLLQSVQENIGENAVQLLTDEDIKMLLKKAEGLESPLNMVQLCRRFELNLGERGSLSGSVLTAYKFISPSDDVKIPLQLREWADFTVISGAQICRLIKSNGQHEILAPFEDFLRIRNVSAGDVVVIEQFVERTPWILFAPWSFDFIPAARHRIPVVEIRYRLRIADNPVRTWCSNNMESLIVEGVLEFRNTRPLVYNSSPCPPLPSFGWSTLSTEEFSVRMQFEIKSKSELCPDMSKFMPKQGTIKERTAFAFNALRKILPNKDTTLAGIFEPANPETILASASATSLEMAVLLSAIARQSGFQATMRIFAQNDKTAVPWQTPKFGDEFFCPSLVGTFCAVVGDETDKLTVRLDSCMPVSADSSHRISSDCSICVFPASPVPTRFFGYDSSPETSIALEMAASDNGTITCSTFFTFRGESAESLARLVSGSRDTDIKSVFARFISRWLGTMSVNAKNVTVTKFAGDEISIGVPCFMLDWSETRRDKRRFPVVPLPVDLAGVIQTDEGFMPSWFGTIRIGIILTGAIDVSVAELYHNYKLQEEFGRLSTFYERQDGRTRFSLLLFVQDGFYPNKLLKAFQNLATRAKEALSTEIRWK